jgi:hypothetical protein
MAKARVAGFSDEHGAVFEPAGSGEPVTIQWTREGLFTIAEDPDVIRGIERVTGERYDPATGQWAVR